MIQNAAIEGRSPILEKQEWGLKAFNNSTNSPPLHHPSLHVTQTKSSHTWKQVAQRLATCTCIGI